MPEQAPLASVIARPSRAPLLGAAIATAIVLVLLVALGAWQLRRLQWKAGLLAQIDMAEKAPPVTLGSATPPLFTRVYVKGTWEPRRALYGAEVQGVRMGAQAMQLLDRPGQLPVPVVLGWIPTDASAPPPSSGPAEVTGYVRRPEKPGWLSAVDDIEGRHLYSLDPATIGAALGVTQVAPFTIVALAGTGGPGREPVPAAALPRPSNNHLQYAFTWFGLAGALVAVSVSWAVKRR